MSVIALKLVNGDELIAKGTFVEGDDGKSFVLAKPRKIQLIPSPQGLMQVMIPYLTMNPDESCTIKSVNIITAYPPSAEFEKNYLQETSGIQLATNDNVFSMKR